MKPKKRQHVGQSGGMKSCLRCRGSEAEPYKQACLPWTVLKEAAVMHSSVTSLCDGRVLVDINEEVAVHA